MNPAPLSLADVLDPRWLEAALSPSGLVVGAVGDVRVVETLKTAATKVRFTIAADDRTVALCVKGFFDAPLRPVAAAISQSEARFYREIAPASGLRLPLCPYAGIDPQSGHGLVIMDDMIVRGGRFFNVLHPYSPAQARGSLEQLAILHAGSWGDARVRSHGFVQSRLAWLLENPLISTPELQALLDGKRGDPLPPAQRDASRMVAALHNLADELAQQAPCIIHGDAHPGNILELDGAQGIVDWQLVQRGSWSLDVAYHIAASLTVEDRRAEEVALLRYYLDAMAAAGCTPPDFDTAWRQYRAHLAYGYYLWALTRGVGADITHELVRRLGLAVADHRSFELLGC